MNTAQVGRENARLLRRLLGAALGGFVFAFALVPLYRIACEEVFGIKLDGEAAAVGDVAAMTVDRSRTVTVQFDANIDGNLAWDFQPTVRSMVVHPGEPMETLYRASNRSVLPLVGQAVPSVAPAEASMYFVKTECFCFTEQQLGAGEARDMPVRFVVDPALPPEVTTLTLSYKFFLNEIATRRVAAASGSEKS